MHAKKNVLPFQRKALIRIKAVQYFTYSPTLKTKVIQIKTFFHCDNLLIERDLSFHHGLVLCAFITQCLRLPLLILELINISFIQRHPSSIYLDGNPFNYKNFHQGFSLRQSFSLREETRGRNFFPKYLTEMLQRNSSEIISFLSWPRKLKVLWNIDKAVMINFEKFF